MPQDSGVLLPIRSIPNSMEALLRKDCFSRVIPHATWTELSRNSSMNMTVKSAYCNRLPSHMIPIQLSICWMRLNIWSRDLLPVNLMLLWEALKTTLASIPVEPLLTRCGGYFLTSWHCEGGEMGCEWRFIIFWVFVPSLNQLVEIHLT